MKAAVLFSVPTKADPGYCWRWRSVDGQACSQKAFVYYYDCLENAWANGYEAQIEIRRCEIAKARRSQTDHRAS